MLCTRRTSWAHACCMCLPPLAAGRSLCTLTSPSSEPPATLVPHFLHPNACNSAAQLIYQKLWRRPCHSAPASASQARDGALACLDDWRCFSQMHAAEPRDRDCPSQCLSILAPMHAWLRCLRTPTRPLTRSCGLASCAFCLRSPAAVRSSTPPSSAGTRRCPVVTRRPAGRVRQGLWLPATPCGCRLSSGPQSGWAARAAPGTAASLLHPSCGQPSSSLIPPVRSATYTTTSCADAPVSSLNIGSAVELI